MIGHDPTRTYKAVVIGAGSGGLTLAIGLAGFGHDTVLVEAGRVGGDCTNVGCIPSKALLHAAVSGERDPFGYVRRKRDDLATREDHEMEEHEQIHLVRGRARLTSERDPHVVEVDAPDGTVHRVLADNVVICAGSQPVEFAIEGMSDDTLVTNETLFELHDVPGTIVLVGGGAISLEMATAFRDLGSAVHIVELADRLIGNDDPLVSSTIRAALERRGVVMHIGTSIERFDEPTRTAHLANGDTIPGVDTVLLAVGRRPRLDGLGLKEAGVETSDQGVVADGWGRTNVDGIFAVGDITGNTLTTHGANAIGRRAVRAIALPYLPKTGDPRAMANAVYSRPEIASVGLSPSEVEAMSPAGRRRYEIQMPGIDRGYTDDLEHGVAMVDVERFSGKILRAAIVGPSAAEIIGMFTLAIDQGIGLRKMFAMVHPYPSYSQVVGQLADDFARDTYPALPKEWWGMMRGRVKNRLARR
ncbi:dihydrolipoyl dehydrogenase family protein [Ilumatobacter coccineus]|uniref:Oxidoreductase n=1 Tax=Ilumatobacter coccineus (strain NBRC 103263 / KCTC 29153 / YM16-304) TaxID=1313172 RepID=A0A6C7ECD6_ILUCY|nr:NAD(P)/FAD-dependent oxidoreductase [Ilumatobacter coccineus]BAN02795.1 oxidoreductase [Ilumatobacter coccineus YM16-304]